MRDDGADVEAGEKHGLHLVPGFENFPAVYAFEEEAFENNPAPIDSAPSGRRPRRAILPPLYMFSIICSRACGFPDISRPISKPPTMPSSL